MTIHNSSILDSALIQAYLETDYHVSTPAPFIIRIGELCEPLIELHKQHGVDCSAFITSWNPYGVDIGEAINQRRLSTLREESLRLANRVLDGFGNHPSNSWPAEPSLLILGLSFEEAKWLGIRHEQNATVWTAADGIPELVQLR